MSESKICVGLSDSETRVQMYDTEKYISILKDVCRNYHVGFSVSAGQGGYFFEDGSYVQETTLVLSLIDADIDTVNEIAKDLCVFFRQESVLITENKVRSYFIKEKL